MGVLRGRFEGRLNNLFELIREAWFLSVSGLQADHRPMVALDMGEPLWHLSKYGCTYRNKGTGHCPKKDRCTTAEFCERGRIKIEQYKVDVKT